MHTKINLAKFTASFIAFNNCKKDNKKEWEEKWELDIDQMLELLPRGSGIDAGVKFDWEKSKADKLIFTLGYHHMDQQGGYDGWTEHKLIITPSFSSGFHIKITGRNRNGIKEYLLDIFNEVFKVDHNYLRTRRKQTAAAA